MRHKAEMITSGENALTKDEYILLLGACDNQEDRVMLMMAVSLGLRRGDVVRVKWADIDFSEGTLTYFERKKDRTRTVPMSPALEQELKILYRVRPSGRKEVLPLEIGKHTTASIVYVKGSVFTEDPSMHYGQPV